jgi:hypothetical protein
MSNFMKYALVAVALVAALLVVVPVKASGCGGGGAVFNAPAYSYGYQVQAFAAPVYQAPVVVQAAPVVQYQAQLAFAPAPVYYNQSATVFRQRGSVRFAPQPRAPIFRGRGRSVQRNLNVQRGAVAGAAVVY